MSATDDVIRMERILDEVRVEREKQDAKWGQQNHSMVPPDGTDSLGKIHLFEHGRKADMWKDFNDQRVAGKRLAWDGILFEEVYEAFAESDPVKIREEMIQVAAVAVAIIECIDRATP